MLFMGKSTISMAIWKTQFVAPTSNWPGSPGIPHLCFSALVGTDEVAVRQHTSCHEPGDWLKLQVAAIIDRYRQ